MTADDRPAVALLVVAGSAASTLARIAEALGPAVRIVPIDVEALVQDAGRRDRVRYAGPGEIADLMGAQPGMVSRLVTALRRPPFLRPLLDEVFALVRAIRPVAPTYRRRAAELLRRERVAVLLTCNDVNTATRSVLAAARDQGIATVLVQEGAFCTITRRRRRWAERAGRLARRVGIGHGLPVDDTYGAFGHDLLLAASDDYARRFAAAGVRATEVRAIGIPRFDPLAMLSPALRARPTVVYVFQPFLRQGRVTAGAMASLEALVDGVAEARRRVNFDFAIKLHPREDEATIAHLAARLCAGVTLLSAEMPMTQVLRAADVVIGHYSTALLEAAILDVPVVCVPIPARYFPETEEAAKQQWFAVSGLPCATDAADVVRDLVAALRQRRRNLPLARLDAEVGPLDGRATDRAAVAVLSLLPVSDCDQMRRHLPRAAAVERAEMLVKQRG